VLLVHAQPAQGALGMKAPHPLREPGRMIDLMEALKKSLEKRSQTPRTAVCERSAVIVSS
jgi:non-homologous end joining protein Ku